MAMQEREKGGIVEGREDATMRCAIYARYSSDRQNPLSIEDQVRQCRSFAVGKRENGASRTSASGKRGWVVLEEHVYTDEAVTGTSVERSGLQALVSAATARKFDCILVDDTSRVSRNQADALRFYERVAFAGVRVVAVSQGIDSSDSQAELMLGVHGLIDSVYSRELAQKTRRGMTGAILRGGAPGGRCYGYRTQLSQAKTWPEGGQEVGGAAERTWPKSGQKEGAKIELRIYEAEAEVVRRVFALSAGGMSLKKIARLLNAEGVACAQPYQGQRHPSWAQSALSVMLHNERYKGCVVWNKTRNVRNPETGRRVHRARPRSEWLRREDPTLRIVAPELWERVNRRLETMKREGCLGGRRANYLLSGLIECGECGSKMVLVSAGRAGERRTASGQKYGCPLAQRGVCKSQAMVRREPLERALLEQLLGAMSAPRLLARVREMEEQATQAGSVDHAAEKVKLKTRIDRLADLIAAGNHSSALVIRLRDMEAQHEAMQVQRIPRAQAAMTQLKELRSLLTTRGTRLKELMLRCVRIEVTPQRGIACGVWVCGGGQSRTQSPLLTFKLTA